MQKVPLTNEKNYPIEFLDERKERTHLLQSYLNGILIIGTLIFFIALYTSIQSKSIFSSVLIVLFFGTLFLATFMHNWSLELRSGLLIGVIFGSGIYSLFSIGFSSFAFIFFLLAVLLMSILISGRWWIVGLFFSGISISFVGVLIQTGIYKLTSVFLEEDSLLYWLSALTLLLFLMFVVISPLTQYIQKTRKIVLDFFYETQAISNDNQNLSEKVITLESEMDRRRSRMITARQIAREIAQQTNTEKLLSDAVNLIRSQMGFYHSGIYLSDIRNETALLRAASGASSKAMMDANYQIRLRDEGIIGYVINRGEPRIALDVDLKNTYDQHSYLPETRSEVAVPLRVGRNIIGAIDIQSEKENAFSIEDVEILQTIADQLAVFMDKTTQINTLRDRVLGLEQGYGVFTRGTWRSHLRGSKRPLHFRFQDNALLTDVNTQKYDSEVIDTGKTILSESINENTNQTESMLSIPIKLREQVLGVINIHYQGKKIPSSIISLLETTTNRLGVSLENARLLEEIQERAEREHTVAEISSKVRAAQDIDAILQTTVAELGKTLDADEVSITLKTTTHEQQ